MRPWPRALPLTDFAAVSIFVVGAWRQSEQLSTIATGRLQVAASYARAEAPLRTRVRCYAGLADMADGENTPLRPNEATDVNGWETRERADKRIESCLDP